MIAHGIDDSTPRGRIIRCVIESEWSCVPVANLIRVGGLGESPGTGAQALEDLILDGWVVRWDPLENTSVATLSPWGAERLDLTLIQPERDGEKAEPRWGRAGLQDGFYEKTGRYAGEPARFLAATDWGLLKRSLTSFDKIVAVRPSADLGPDMLAHSGELAVLLVNAENPKLQPRKPRVAKPTRKRMRAGLRKAS